MKVKVLGIIIYSISMNVSLPQGKLDKLLDAFAVIEAKGSATKRELDDVAGLMAHCATIIKGGRTFSHRVYDMCNSLNRHSRVKLSSELILDLDWWKNFCKIFNGSASVVPCSSSFSIISDASFSGFGAWCDAD